MYFKSIACALVTVILLSACAQTKQARHVERKALTGFLGDYSSLREGADDQALLRYIKPGVNFRQYNKVIVDPVTIWTNPDSDLAKLSHTEKRKLADRFYAHLITEISELTTVTNQPEYGTIRIQVALTDAEKSRAVLDTVSTVVPVGLAASTVKEIFTGQAAFTGSTGMEIKVSDAVTGDILAAAVDKRVGNKHLGLSTFSQWGDTDSAMEYWSQLISYRICQYRGQRNCAAPR